MPIPLGILAVAGAGAGAAGSYQLIQSTILTGSQSTITFSSIPSTFTHLQLRMTHRNTRTGSANGAMVLEFNSDTGANYSAHELFGNGSSVSSVNTFAVNQNYMVFAYSPEASQTTDAFAASVVDILDYTNTGKNKTVRALSGIEGATDRISLHSGFWRNTNAITSINMYVFSGSFVSGSRFSLYGIQG